MSARTVLSGILLLSASLAVAADPPVPGDRLPTSRGELLVHPFGHASLFLQWNGLSIAVDPVGGAARYADLPRPHLILITHRHGDHFDIDTLRDLAGEHTVVITPADVAESIPANDPVALANGDTTTAHGVIVIAVPAYNRTAGRLEYHPRGRDNGYVLDLSGFRVFISGDTEDVPELASLGRIDAAFLCMNLPWTMSVKQAAAAARLIAPRVLYPYHFRNRGGTMADLDALTAELAAEQITEVRILDWY
jgi:L-ascorbate metabolism protein UlaG (beta-lactamase superfamily)